MLLELSYRAGATRLRETCCSALFSPSPCAAAEESQRDFDSIVSVTIGVETSEGWPVKGLKHSKDYGLSNSSRRDDKAPLRLRVQRQARIPND